MPDRDDRDDDIDFEQVVWDPRYRRQVIERLNRAAGRVRRESLPFPAEGDTGTKG